MGVDPSRKRLGKKLAGILHRTERKIMDPAAGFADKMVMGLCPVVKVFGTVSAGKASNFAELRKEI